MRYPVKQLRKDVCFLLCYGLSLTVVTGMVFWLDQDASGLTSDVALEQADHSINSYCQQSGMSNCDMKLVDASAPEDTSESDRWNFQYYSPTAGTVTVRVQDDGDEHPASQVYPEEPFKI